MTLHLPTILKFSAFVTATLPGIGSAWEPETYPEAPDLTHTSGFVVDNHNRNDVLALWHAVYQASEGYQKRIEWTGNYNGKPGRTSKVFITDVERRINYFRAMCGVPAIVHVNSGSKVMIEGGHSHKPSSNTLKQDAAQAAALMLIRNYNPLTGSNPAIDHDPAPSLTGWSAATWNANAQGNLAFGVYGPGAITEYMVEEIASGSATSAWNSLVGHRRWCLYSEATDFATGDQPGESASRPPTNVLYIAQNKSEKRQDPTPGFVAYPAPGFFPAPVNSRYWSLSRADADFSAATVKVTDSKGKTVPVSNIKRNNNYGDPAIIWEVSGSAASKSLYSDATFNVKVANIAGPGIPASFSYSVTLINPDRLTSNQTISGSSIPVSTKTTPYTFTPPKGADALQVTAFLEKNTAWRENAEDPTKAEVIDGTASNYPLFAKTDLFGDGKTVVGLRSFNLTFPTSYDLIARGVPEQWFELDRLILPNTDARLIFNYRRGFMTKGSTLAVEMTSNGGVTWKRIGSTISGVSNSNFDASVSTASIALAKSSQPIRIRFRYYTKPREPIYTYEAAPTSPTGIFIDNITTKGCDWLSEKKSTSVGAKGSSYSFNATSAGGSLVEGSRWHLALRTKLGGKWFPHGPLKSLKITAP